MTVEALKKKQKEELDVLKSSHAYERITGVENFVSGDTIFLSPKSEKEVGDIIKALEPYSTAHKIIRSSGTVYLNSPYMFKADPCINDHKIIFEWYQINNKQIRVSFPLTILTEKFKEKFLVFGERHMTSSEYPYFKGLATSTLRELKVPSFGWGLASSSGGYGGCSILLDVDRINEIVKYFKTLRNGI